MFLINVADVKKELGLLGNDVWYNLEALKKIDEMASMIEMVRWFQSQGLLF